MSRRTWKAKIHYNKHGSREGRPWTVHWRGKCHVVAHVDCQVSFETVYRPQKKDNPRSWIVANVSNVEIDDEWKAVLT